MSDVGVGILNNKVVLKFHEPVEAIEFDAQNCIDIAMAMTDAAYELKNGVKPVGDTLKADLIERHRDTLIPRVNMIMNSTREKKTVTNGRLSMTIIDTVFSEIFS